MATSAGGLEVGCGVALDDGVLSVGGMPAVCLPTAIRVGPAALGHAHGQFRATSTARLEHGVLDLSTGIGDGEIEAGSGGTDHGLSVGDGASVPWSGSGGQPLPQHDLVHELAGHRSAAKQVADHEATGHVHELVATRLDEVDSATATQQVAVDLISTLGVGVEAGDGQHGSEAVEELTCSGDGGLHCGYCTTDQEDRKTSDSASYTADGGESIREMIEHGDRHVGVGILEGGEASSGHVVSWLTWLV